MHTLLFFGVWGRFVCTVFELVYCVPCTVYSISARNEGRSVSRYATQLGVFSRVEVAANAHKYPLPSTYQSNRN